MLYHKPRVHEWSKTLTTTPQKSLKRSPRKQSISSKTLVNHVLEVLETQSAEDIINLDIRGKSTIADYMIVASGRSNRHVNALADYVQRGLKEVDHTKLGVEGLAQCDWVLIDAGDVIIHLFRPEVREFYALEKLWSIPALTEDQ